MSMIRRDLPEKSLVAYPSNGPGKYTIRDWNYNNQVKSRISCDQQKLADRVINESERVIDETKQTTEKWKKETDHRLIERIEDISFRVEELKNQKKDAMQEEKVLKDYKVRIDYAIKSIENEALVICQKCIVLREHRTGIDKVDDDVDKELRKERDVICKCIDILEKLFSESTEQVRRLRSAVYLLDRDLANKEKSMTIDQNNLILRENLIDLYKYEGKKDLDPYNSTDPEWIKDTLRNIDSTVKELNSAKSLRSYVDILLRQVVEDIETQVQRTNEAFKNRIGEMRYTKVKLEGLHCKTAQQVNEITRNITKLEKELAEKEGFIALSQMRLGNRAQRPGLELCRDNAQNTLMMELSALRATCQKLIHMIEQSKTTLRYLLNTQMLQEEEINLKINSLKIDEVDCMSIRESLKFHDF